MPTIWIPAPLRPLAGGAQAVAVPGRTVREVIDHLEARYPGIRERLLEGDELRPGLAVSVDGEVVVEGLRARVAETSEVFILPAIGGGERSPVPPGGDV